MPSCTIRGPEGVVTWGYHHAATLGPWTLTASDTGGEVTAAVTSSDDYKLSQPALKFCVPRQNGTAWKWPVLSLWVADGTLHASLGPQE
jgi:hypothetical protein